MNEPNRIGLSSQANEFLDEMLEELNNNAGEHLLIKFDLYRLAVAMGVKNRVKAPPVQTNSSLRVDELDEGKALYYSVEAAGLNTEGETIYRAVERLADHGIREFYENFQKNSGEMDWSTLLD